MTVKEVKEMFAGQYADVEYYQFQFQGRKSIHTDYIESLEDVSENETVEDWLLADEETYSTTIYANTGMNADFTDWYDNADAKVLIIIVKR